MNHRFQTSRSVTPVEPPPSYPQTSSHFAVKKPGTVSIRSSTNVDFYVPRYLLEYVSPVFKDMLELGPDGSGLSSDETVKLTEDTETLEALFQHMDPNLAPPSMDIKRLWAVVTAAQKYHMDGTIQKLRSSIVRPTIIKDSRNINLVQSNPLPIVVLSNAFNFDEERRMALKELARCHIDFLLKNEQDCTLPSSIFQYVLQLRRARAQWLKAKARQLFLIKANKRNDKSNEDCPQCMRYRAYHVHEALLKIDDHPSWDVFYSEISKSSKCSCGGPTIPLDEKIKTWEAEARELEAALPAWPPQ